MEHTLYIVRILTMLLVGDVYFINLSRKGETRRQVAMKNSANSRNAEARLVVRPGNGTNVSACMKAKMY